MEAVRGTRDMDQVRVEDFQVFSCLHHVRGRIRQQDQHSPLVHLGVQLAQGIINAPVEKGLKSNMRSLAISLFYLAMDELSAVSRKATSTR